MASNFYFPKKSLPTIDTRYAANGNIDLSSCIVTKPNDINLTTPSSNIIKDNQYNIDFSTFMLDTGMPPLSIPQGIQEYAVNGAHFVLNGTAPHCEKGDKAGPFPYTSDGGIFRASDTHYMYWQPLNGTPTKISSLREINGSQSPFVYYFEASGGGGGGGGGQAAGGGGGGGGASGLCGLIDFRSGITTIQFHIGQGGAGGYRLNNGSNGGTTTIIIQYENNNPSDITIYLYGGQGGRSYNNGATGGDPGGAPQYTLGDDAEKHNIYGNTAELNKRGIYIFDYAYGSAGAKPGATIRGQVVIDPCTFAQGREIPSISYSTSNDVEGGGGGGASIGGIGGSSLSLGSGGNGAPKQAYSTGSDGRTGYFEISY